jgi:hypothetical protein
VVLLTPWRGGIVEGPAPDGRGSEIADVVPDRVDVEVEEPVEPTPTSGLSVRKARKFFWAGLITIVNA